MMPASFDVEDPRLRDLVNNAIKDGRLGEDVEVVYNSNKLPKANFSRAHLTVGGSQKQRNSANTGIVGSETAGNQEDEISFVLSQDDEQSQHMQLERRKSHSSRKTMAVGAFGSRKLNHEELKLHLQSSNQSSQNALHMPYQGGNNIYEDNPSQNYSKFTGEIQDGLRTSMMDSSQENQRDKYSSVNANEEENGVESYKQEENKNDKMAVEKQDYLKNYDKRALFIFSHQSYIRNLCAILVRRGYLDNFVLGCIFLNCIALSLFDYERNSNLNQQSSSLLDVDIVDISFSGLFLIEMIIRVIFKGMIIHKRSHFRKAWAYIDVVIIVSGIIEIFFPPKETQALRIIRIIFKPLKTINSLPSMKKLIRSLLKSLPDFINVGVFMVFVFILFATMGVQQYSGQIYNQCRFEPYPHDYETFWLSDLSISRPCSQNGLGSFTCPNDLTCGNIQDFPEVSFESDHYETKEYLNYGITNFDNLGTSLLTVFQMIMSETWFQQQKNLMDIDLPLVGALYCISIIIIGQIFLLNLILAVIIQAFMKSQQEEVQLQIKDLEQQEFLDYQSSSEESENESEDYEEEEQDDGDDVLSQTDQKQEEELKSGGGGDKDGFANQEYFDDLKNQSSVLSQRRHSHEEILIDEEDDDSGVRGQSQFQLGGTRKSKRATYAETNRQENESISLENKSFEKSDKSNEEGQQYHIAPFYKRSQTTFAKSLFSKAKSGNQRISNAKTEGRIKKLKATFQDVNGDFSKNRFSKRSARKQKKVLMNMGDLIKQDTKLREQERKYHNHDGFADFLRKHAMTRKIVDIFAQMRESKLQKKLGKDQKRQSKMQVELISGQAKQLLAAPSIVKSGTNSSKKKRSNTINFSASMKEGRHSCDSLRGNSKMTGHYIVENVDGSSINDREYLNNSPYMQESGNFSLPKEKSNVSRSSKFIDLSRPRISDSMSPKKSKFPTVYNVRGRYGGIEGLPKMNAAFNLTLPTNPKKAIEPKSRASSSKSLYRNSKIFQTCPINIKENEMVNRMRSKLIKNIEAVEKGTSNQKSVQAKNTQNDNLAGLLNKKFILEVKKNMVENLIKVAVQKSMINDRKKDNKFIDAIFNLQNNPIFVAIMQLIVLVNIVVISIDHYPLDLQQLVLLEYWNWAFSAAYIFEIFLKISGLGFKGYLKMTGFNIYDSIIGVVSILDIIVVKLFLNEEMLVNSEIITVFRSLRALRIFKLARYWRGFRILLETLWLTILNIQSFTCLLLVVLFSYTLLGLEFFAHKTKLNRETNIIDEVNGVSPVFNFDSIIDSFLTVFIIFTNDEQSKIYYDYYRAGSPVISTIFWISFVIVAQKILFNVFIAIILQKFNELNLKTEIMRIEEESYEQNTNLLQQLRRLTRQIIMRCKHKEISVNEMDIESKEFQSEAVPQNQKKEDTKEHGEHEGDGNALWCFGKDNKLRNVLEKIIHHRRYENFIVVCILVTGLQLILETPTLDPESQLKQALYWINVLTLIIFTLEFFVKIIVLGFFFNGPHSYLKNIWNVNDFIILIFSSLYLSSIANSFKLVKTLKFMKALRLISRNQNLQVAVRALLFAIPNIFRFSMIMCLFFLTFAVVLVSFFKGKLSYCNESMSYEYHQSVESKWDCLDHGGDWMNEVYNFDNIAQAMITLFVMSTTNGWGEIMNSTLNSTEIDYRPIKDLIDHTNNPMWIFFFVIFIVFGGFFFLNLFVGVVLNTFYMQSEKVGGGELLTEKQRVYIDMRLLVLRSAPIIKSKPSENKVRKLCFFIQQHRHFERFIQLCIVANTLILMLQWYRKDTSIDAIQEILNWVFTLIFFLEALIRILGVGPIIYFKDGWNIFDFIIALGSIVGIIISQGTSFQIKGTSILRAFRILRLLRLLKRGGQSLNLIFNTLIITLQTLSNIGALLILFTYIYSIIGMMYFGEVKRTGNMNDYINFESFTTAFLTLFTVATGDSWKWTMESFAQAKSPSYDCVNDPSYQDYQDNNYQTIGCGSKVGSFIFFVTFYFIVRLIFLKLFIAVILEGYLKTQVQDTRLFNNEQREKFRHTWAEYDPDATTFIKLADLRHFLFSLGAPLGFDETFTHSKFLQDKFIASLELPTYRNFRCYQFLDVLDALSFRLMVMDHLNKLDLELLNGNQGDQLADLGRSNAVKSSKEGVKDIEQEVNRLIYQKQSENIVAFKELWEKEQINKKSRDFLKDDLGLTSAHHMALEAIIRRVKSRWAAKGKVRINTSMHQSPMNNGLISQFDSMMIDDVVQQQPTPHFKRV